MNLANIKTHPELEIRAYPLTARQVAVNHNFGLCDRFSAMVKEVQGENMPSVPRDLYINGIRLTSPGAGGPNQPIREMTRVKYWELPDEQTGTAPAVFTVQPTIVPCNNLIDYKGIPSSKYLVVEWEALRGDYWTTTIPDDDPAVAAVTWYSGTNDDGIAQTVLPLPRAQSWAAQIKFKAPARSPVRTATEGGLEERRYILSWGNERYAIEFRDGGGPNLLKRGFWTRPTVDTSLPGDTPLPQLEWVQKYDWVLARSFKKMGTDYFSDGEPIWVYVYHIAGRLVVDIEARGVHERVTLTEPIMKLHQEAIEFGPAISPVGHLRVHTWGVPATLRVHEIKWGAQEQDEDTGEVMTDANDKAIWVSTGRFTRAFSCTRRISDTNVTSSAFGTWGTKMPNDSDGAGRTSPSQLANITISRQGPGRYQYVCQMAAENPELEMEDVGIAGTTLKKYVGYAMAGGITPAIHSVAVRYASVHTRTSGDALLLSPAILHATEECVDPILAPGPQWNVRVNRNLLPECLLESGAAVGANWPDYVDAYHPVDAHVAWRYQDGTQRAYINPTTGVNSGWIQRLGGYISRVGRQIEGVNRQEMDIALTDPIIRFQSPAAKILHEYAPLALLAAEGAITKGRRKNADFYGHEAVKYMVDEVLGHGLGALPHGVGPQLPSGDDFRAVLPAAGTNPLIKYKAMMEGAKGDELLFVPPWRQSVLDWIRMIAEYDFAVFFFAGNPNTGQIAPTYADYFALTAASPTTTIYDANYDAVSGWSNYALMAADESGVPSADFNRVFVMGRYPGGDDRLRMLMPSLPQITGDARIESGSLRPEQDIDKTWERTYLIEGTQFHRPGSARRVAFVALSLLHNIDVKRSNLTCRGIEWLWWGHKINPQMTAPESDDEILEQVDPTDDLRVMRITNEYQMEQRKWTARILAAPQPNL